MMAEKSKRCYIHVEEVTKSSSHGKLTNSKPVQLKQGYRYLEREEYDDRMGVHVCAASKTKSNALSLLINRYVPPSTKKHGAKDKEKEKGSSMRAALDIPADKIAMDVHVGMSSFKILNTFLSLIHIPKSKSSSAISIWPDADNAERVLFAVVMQKIVYFVKVWERVATHSWEYILTPHFSILTSHFLPPLFSSFTHISRAQIFHHFSIFFAFALSHIVFLCLCRVILSYTTRRHTCSIRMRRRCSEGKTCFERWAL